MSLKLRYCQLSTTEACLKEPNISYFFLNANTGILTHTVNDLHLFQNFKLLLQPDCPLSDIKALVSHAINQLPEGHSEYDLAVSLVELIQSLS